MDDASRLFGTGIAYFCDLLAIELRNLEAMGLAQQKMLEGLGVLAQRQAEIAQGTLQGTLQRVAEPAASTNGQSVVQAAIDRIGSLRTTILESQSNASTLSEIAARQGGEVANILQSRMIAALDELRAALERTVTEKPAVAATLVHQPGSPA